MRWNFGQYFDLILNNRKLLFLTLLVFRLINALFIKTFYVPDEYWQSIEVAHTWVFGYGSLTWEWHPDVALRSPFHPFLISIVYRVLAFCGLNHWWWLMIKAPQFLHSFLAALVDYYLYQFTWKMVGTKTAKWTLFHQLTNWFTFYCAPRTLSNGLEWFLVSMGLAHFPWDLLVESKTKSSSYKFGNPRIFILIVICGILLRPTAAIVWFPFCCVYMYKSYPHAKRIVYFDRGNKFNKVKQCSIHLAKLFRLHWATLVICLTIVCLLDRCAYGHWTVNQWNFVRFNVLSAGSSFYGVQPWHWYLTQGFVAILLTQIPFVLHMLIVNVLDLGVRIEKPNHYEHKSLELENCAHRAHVSKSIRLLAFVICWTLVCYSFLSHKEFRFLFPIVPFAMYLCGLSSFHWCHKSDPNSRQMAIILFVLTSHAPMALYTTLVHQRGTLDVMRELRHRIDQISASENANLQAIRVLSLMPCHSLPSVGYLSRNISLRQLSCDPNLANWFVQSEQPYVDEADLFYENPSKWLVENYNHSRQGSNHRPDYIVMFSQLIEHYKDVRELLHSWNYQKCAEFIHAHFLTHNRHGRYVLLYCANHIYK